MGFQQSERMITEGSVVVAARDQISADLADEAVILHLKSGMYYGLDTVGAQIWSLIQQPRTVHDVKEALLKEFEVAPDRCERELWAFLQELATHKLIEVSDGRSA